MRQKPEVEVLVRRESAAASATSLSKLLEIQEDAYDSIYLHKGLGFC